MLGYHAWKRKMNNSGDVIQRTEIGWHLMNSECLDEVGFAGADGMGLGNLLT
jgi:hypothetical protein